MKNLLIALFCLLICACSSEEQIARQDACSVLDNQTRVHSGTRCSSEKSAVLFLVASDDSQQRSCSGALLTSQHVLTAAHCVFGYGPDQIAIRLEEETRVVYEVHIHPDYIHETDDPEINIFAHDLAVLRLKVPVKEILPLPLLVSRPPFEGDIVSIFGYGYDEVGDFDRLNSGQMRITAVEEKIILTSNDNYSGSSLCAGDSGGPALYLLIDQGFKPKTGIIGVNSAITNPNTSSPMCRHDNGGILVNIQSSTDLEFILKHAPESELI